MAYETRYGSETYTYYVTNSRRVFTGFEDVTRARAKFIFFKCEGLTPNTRHFFFFDNKNVTNYISTDSVNAPDDYYTLPRNDPKRSPGRKFVNETGFPTEYGGPTSEIYSDDTGKIEGLFYLQSNNDFYFPTGTRTLTAIDISVLNLENAISKTQQQFVIDGGIERYRMDYYRVAKTGTRSYSYNVWVADPEPPEPPVEEGPGDVIVNEPIPETPEGGDGGGGGTVIEPEPEPDPDPKPEPEPEPESGFVKDVIDDGILGNRNDSIVDEVIVGAVIGAAVGGTVAAAVGGSLLGAVAAVIACCFIMLESRYGDGTMDEVVRRYRDEKMTDRNRRGYYKVAQVLVPLMRKSKIAKWIVTKTFADPLVCYGKWYYGQNKYGWIFKPVEKFWMNVFDAVGGEVEFIRENGEVV
jgi:hypothetical protein